MKQPSTWRWCIAALLLCAACVGEDATIQVRDDDAPMDRAMDRTRAEVPAFIAQLANPQMGSRNFRVKVPIRDGDQVEHFWLQNVR